MFRKRGLFVLVLLSLPTIAHGTDHWTLGPFVKQNEVNPILHPLATSRFDCPVRKQTVRWEEKDVFNPATVVKDGRVYLLYRAEDKAGKHRGTSRIGLAVSADGLHFHRVPGPVFFPDNDRMKRYEWEGGCEDPRMVEDDHGTYYMTYTAYNGRSAHLSIATSQDLVHWKKQGRTFARFYRQNRRYTYLASKAGAIVTRRVGSRFIATRINGKYWMYWFDDPVMRLAHSTNLKDWEPVLTEQGELKTILAPRPNHFDSRLTEPGPPAVLTERGILLIYNGMNLDSGEKGTYEQLPPSTYAAGQVLFAAADPSRVLQRTVRSFLKPDKPYEWVGQVNRVCFFEGLSFFKGKWFLYYGTADSKIAVAVATNTN